MYDTESLRIPLFAFKWPSACSPHAQAVEQHVLEWVEHQQLIPDNASRERTSRGRYGWLAARCFPTAPLQLLETIADYIAWLFLVDDLFFDRVQTLSPHTVAHITAVIDVLDLHTTQPQPVFGERALLDICQRLQQHMDAERFQHFAHGTRMIYASAALQILAHLNDEPITLRQYECIRRHGSGMIPSLSLLDSCTPTHLEGRVRFSREVQQLKDSTNTIVSLSNDIYSLKMELKQPGQYENMVTLQAGTLQTLQQGIDSTANTIRAEIEHFTQRTEQLLVGAGPALSNYIHGLRYWLSGHQQWIESDTARYAAEFADSDADLRSVAHALHCADSITAP